MWTCTTCPHSPKLIIPHTQATHYTNNGYRASSLCCNRCSNTHIPCNSRCSNLCSNQCNRQCSKPCNSQCSRPYNTLHITSRISNRPPMSLLAGSRFSQSLFFVLYLLVTIITNPRLAFKGASDSFLYQYPIGGNPRYQSRAV